MGSRVRSVVTLLLIATILTGAVAETAPMSARPGNASFSVFSLKDGLVNASVSAIIQDSKGFIWMSTQGGLVRYDGSSFRTWQNQPFDTNTLATDLVQTLFLDKDDTIWAGTYNGLDRLDPATGNFTLYKNDGADPASLSNNLVIAIARDGRGRLWVGTANGLNRLDEATGHFVRYFNRPGDRRSLPHDTIRALHLDARGRLWVGTAGGGFALYDPVTDDFTVLAGSPEKGPRPAGIPAGPPESLALQAIGEDSDGSLWLGAWGTGLVHYDPDSGKSKTYVLPDLRIYVVDTSDSDQVRVGTWGGGMFVLDKKSGTLVSYRHSNAVGALPHDVVYSMLEDASGELWIGTNGGGVARMDRNQDAYSTFTANPDDPGALPSGKINSILVDSRKQLWVSVYARGISRLDPATGKWEHYRHDPRNPGGLADDTAVQLYEDREGNFWAATNSGLCLFDRAANRFGKIRRFGGVESRDADIVYFILEDRRRSGVYWIGTYTKGLYRWDRNAGTWENWRHEPGDPTSLSDNLVNSLAYDREGRLWIATNNGLDRLDNGKFINYYYDPANRKGLSSSAIISLFVDSAGELWIATRSGGLDSYQSGDDGFTHITRAEGLPSNDVYNVIEGAEGDLWIVCQTGLARRDHATGTVKTVTLGNNLDGTSYNQGAFADRDGRLYFGSVGVLTVFDPTKYHANAHQPPVFVTDFIAANRPKLAEPETTGSIIHLASWENSIEFRFAALDYRHPEQNLFAWKLEGFDKDWTWSSARRFATYTNLGGGAYVFRVKAANNDGVWNNDGAAISFTVENPPWRSPAAIGLYLLLIALVGYGFATLRANRLLAAKVRELTEARGKLELATAEARRLAAEAEDATRAKSDFIAMVSHEIRNSLNGIVGVAELLSRSALAERQAEEVGVIRQSADLLLALVNDILDLSKAETERIELENLAWKPRELAARLKALHEGVTGDHGVDFIVDIAPEVPETLGGDPTRIQQIVENLLSNAIRFTERGSVRLGFSLLEPSADGKTRLGISVRDSGTGISREKLSSIFEPFRQADPSISRRFGGTGLGLSIVKQLVERMGGGIEVESEPGQGSRFSVSLPLPSPPTAAPAERAAVQGSASRLRVLIVDDDPVNRRVAAGLVEWLGGKPAEVESGAAAVEALGDGRWDVVLLDERMPAMDGFETARRIRRAEAEKGRPRVPIFSMTARLEGDLRGRCEAAGMDGFLAKPITLESLGALLSRIEGGSEPEAEEETRTVSANASSGRQAPNPDRPLFNVAYFEERYPADDNLGAEILELWLANTAGLYDRAREAGRNGNWTAVRNHVHRLGGSTSIISDGPVVAEFREIEKAIIAAEGDETRIAAILPRLEALAPSFAAFVAALKGYLDRMPRS